MNQSPRENQTRETYGKEDVTKRLLTDLDPSSPASESYRTLRTNLLYGLVDAPPKLIAITSPQPREGKSTTCANLGVVLAQAAKRTLVIDCDLRKPMLHRIFGLHNIYGILDILTGAYSEQEVWQEPINDLKVITAGQLPPNPTEILGSRRFAGFLTHIREKFDYVLIDSPPVGLVSDAAIIAARGDGVLLVFDAQNTSKRALRQSVRNLEAVGANIIGTVMNNVKVPTGDLSYYGYSYK